MFLKYVYHDPVVKTVLPLQGARVWPLTGVVSHVAWHTRKKTKQKCVPGSSEVLVKNAVPNPSQETLTHYIWGGDPDIYISYNVFQVILMQVAQDAPIYL